MEEVGRATYNAVNLLLITFSNNSTLLFFGCVLLADLVVPWIASIRSKPGYR
jgi:hypothetical protein